MASAGKSGKGNGPNVTKKQLVDAIAGRSGLSRHDVQLVVKGMLDELVEAVRQGNRVELRDFGVFEVKERAARTAQNPKTLEPVPVPPKRAVRFKPGRLMREALEGPAAGESAPVVDPSSNGHIAAARPETPIVEVPVREAATASNS
ncbi:MAG: HU family DNA-binding protein [Phycisphaerales bacterium]|jgi:nucleoid DNA-binding protein